MGAKVGPPTRGDLPLVHQKLDVCHADGVIFTLSAEMNLGQGGENLLALGMQAAITCTIFFP